MSKIINRSISHVAIPKDERQAKIQLKTLQESYRTRQHGSSILTFDLNYNQIDFAVTFLFSPEDKPWILAFNAKGKNSTPLILKVFPGFRVGAFYSPQEKDQLRGFFGTTPFKKGDINLLFSTFDSRFKLKNNSADFNDRANLLSLQSKPEDIDKIYFNGFRHNTPPNRRSTFNSLKVQSILPRAVWEQIKEHPEISVRFTTDGYRSLDDEVKAIQEQWAKIKNENNL